MTLPWSLLDSICSRASELGASDIHLQVDAPIRMRVQGEMVFAWEDHRSIVAKDFLEMRAKLLGLDQSSHEDLSARHELDVSYIDPMGTSFRVNIFQTLGKGALVARRIERRAHSLEELNLPPAVSKILQQKQGLFLVTGPTGSGKSTTIVSLIEQINLTRSEHIITIEDPIEFLFTPSKSLFSQRELGRDTSSFSEAIRAAMRQDPNVIFVGEMRDRDTVEAAVNLAETGHLVFSTLHTSSSSQTISRILQFFPPEIQEQVRSRLADSLLGVLSQRLLPNAKWGIRVPIHELMLVDTGIQNLIKTGELVQVNNAIDLGSSSGMISMRRSCERLEAAGFIRREDYIGYLTN